MGPATVGPTEEHSSPAKASRSVPRREPWALKPKWRGQYDRNGVWRSGWPSGLCKECGESFDGLLQHWCSPQHKKKAYSRSNSHAARTRKRLASGETAPRYHIIGKFELVEAFGGQCALCHDPVSVQEAWVGHIRAVKDGGQHTRENVAPVHRKCEQDFTSRAMQGQDGVLALRSTHRT